VTGELEKLVACDRYKGDYHIHTISDSGMKISHIGHSIVQIPSRDFVLKIFSILHKAVKILYLFID
jgi:hypothetical protein